MEALVLQERKASISSIYGERERKVSLRDLGLEEWFFLRDWSGSGSDCLLILGMRERGEMESLRGIEIAPLSLLLSLGLVDARPARRRYLRS